MSSTDLQQPSSDEQVPPPELTQDQQSEAALREGIELRENVKRLTQLLAAASIGRNLATEDELVRREMLGNKASASAGEDVQIVAARDVIYQMPGSQPATTSPGAPVTPGASSGGDSVAPGTGLPTWLKVGLAGLALAGSGGAGAAITSLLSNATTVIQQPANDTDTNSALRFKKDGA